MRCPAGDPLAGQLKEGALLGLLGIEPHTRRRNRMNGTVEALDAAGFMVAVQQSFGNCPRYIQAREPVWRRRRRVAASRRCSGSTSSTWPRTASSAAPTRCSSPPPTRTRSWRQGRRGRCELARRRRVAPRRPPGLRAHRRRRHVLTVPDFNGNRFFNTLGNLAVHPRAGLLFIDFDNGDCCTWRSRPRSCGTGPRSRPSKGAERLMRFHVTHALRRPVGPAAALGRCALSPHLAGTGQWNKGMRALADGR
jgi:predicted pyridoxine 5'-phosphate oxidase superfamily flavin-nucleotide-binding protein